MTPSPSDGAQVDRWKENIIEPLFSFPSALLPPTQPDSCHGTFATTLHCKMISQQVAPAPKCKGSDEVGASNSLLSSSVPPSS